MRSETIQHIISHYDTILTQGLADFGPDPNPMWMASLDVHTGQYPADDLRPPDIRPRVSRYIHAPGGVNLYWDQPHLVAAHALSHITGQPRFADAADAYVSAFLERSVATCGLFLWGNHYFYDVFRGANVWFNLNIPPRELGFHTITAYLHDLRPIPPAWELFWRINPQVTEEAILSMAEQHLIDPSTGEFGCHADHQTGHDYLEFGGILVESMTWLYARSRDRKLIDMARLIATFSYEQRHAYTGLIPLAGTSQTWKNHLATTEIGLWAGSLLRAARYSGLQQFQTMAHDAVLAYLDYAWDADSQQYFGRLNISDGTPFHAELQSQKMTLYLPGVHTDIWNAQFPTHDYPLAMAAACAALYQRAPLAAFELAIQRWADLIAARTYEGRPRVCYAETFGRAIHFLLSAAKVLDENRYRVQAVELADIAVETLFAGRMFRGHTGEDRYDAVDGVGCLLLALLELETDHELDYMGFGF